LRFVLFKMCSKLDSFVVGVVVVVFDGYLSCVVVVGYWYVF